MGSELAPPGTYTLTGWLSLLPGPPCSPCPDLLRLAGPRISGPDLPFRISLEALISVGRKGEAGILSCEGEARAGVTHQGQEAQLW